MIARRPIYASVLLSLAGASVGRAQITTFQLSSTTVNPGEIITVTAGYTGSTTAFVTTPYAVETDETPPGFSYDSSTLRAKLTPANPQSFSISTAGWKPGLYNLTLQASNGDYRDFAVKVGMPNSQYRIIKEYDGPLATGQSGVVQNLLALPDGSVLAGIYRSAPGANVGETWTSYNPRPLTYGERYLVNGSSVIIGMGAAAAATATPGVFQNTALRYSYNEGDSSTTDAIATINVPLARAGVAHGPYEGPLIFRSIVHIPDGTTNGTLLATAYANFVGDDTLWRWTGPNADSTTINPDSKRARSIVIKSTDGGHNWNYFSTIAVDQTTGMEGYDETVMKRLPDGRLVALMRTGDEAWAGYGPGSGQLGNGWMDNPLMMARSDDNGATWSKPRRAGVEGVSPDLTVLSDGMLVSSYGRPGSQLMFSVDGGNSWIDHYSIDPERYRGYTAVAETSPGVLLVSYRAKDWRDPITGVRSDVARIQRLRISRWGEGILAYDSFDCASVGNLGGGSGGNGFSGPWYSDAALSQEVDIAIEPKSLAAPNGYGKAPEGGRLVGVSTSSRAAYRALAPASRVSLAVDQDYYASVLVRRTNSGSGSENFTLSLLSGTSPEVQFAVSSTGVPTIVSLGATATGTGLFGFDETFLFAMKISAKAGSADRAYMKLYGANDVVNLTEPTTWNVVGNTEVNSAILDRVGISWGNEASLIYQIDEFRLAKTWEEAVILGGRRVRPTGVKAYEPFNYGGNLNAANGGSGFSGRWYSDAGLTQPASATLIAGSLSPPGGYAPNTQGNRIRGVSSDTRAIYRGLADEAKIRLDIDQDYYVTLLASRSDSGGTGSRGFTLSLLSGTTPELRAALSSSGDLSILDLGATVSTSGNPFGFDQTFLMVLKIAASAADSDRAYLKLFGEGDIVDFADPSTWTLAGNLEMNDAVLDRIGVAWGTSSSLILELDELRISTNWEDAVRNTITAGADVVSVNSTWNVNGGGNWSAAGNWQKTAPNSVGATANFAGIITQPRTVTVDTPLTIGAINFDSAVSYTLAGGGTVTLEVGAGRAAIKVAAGSHTIAAPVVLNDDTTITTAAAAGIALTGELIAAGKTITKEGAGTAQFQNVRAAGLTINEGSVKISAKSTANSATGTSVVNNLSVASASQLDLTNNSLVIDYDSAGTLVGDLRQMLQSGKLTTSSSGGKLGYADNAVTGLATFSGQVVDSTSLLIKFTYGGDANLDGQVDISDLGALATAWQTSSVWTGGDFGYSGFVDISDLGILATNWQLGVGSPLGPDFDAACASLGLPGISAPEPAATFIVPMMLSFRGCRRRRG